MRPILFTIGNFPVRSFGIFVLIGFLLAAAYARKQIVALYAKDLPGPDKDGNTVLTPDHVMDFALPALLISILGARTLYVILNWHEFSGRLADVVKVWTGGISVHGALVAGGFYMVWYCKSRKINIWKFGDVIAPAFAIGYAVGRIGCFLNGCCYGHACDLPWATRFLKDGLTNEWTVPSHPTQIYASLMNLVILVFLHRMLRRPHKDGQVLLSYFALYAIYRFIDEYFRRGASAHLAFMGLTHSQVFSLLVLPVILVALWRRVKG